MKRSLLVLMCICSFLFACTEKDLYENDGNSNKGGQMDFSFQNTTEKNLSVYAQNSSGEYASNVPVSIYVENPYDENGLRKPGVTSIAYGVTDANGKLNVELSKIPNECSQLYVLTDWPGFGGMQTYELEAGGDVILRGPQSDESTIAKSKTRAVEEYSGKLINKDMNLYTYLNDLDNKGCPLKDGDLVSDVTISKELTKLVSEWYPEAKNVRDDKYLVNPEYCTDMEIKDEFGCEVWATYIGDGGFSNASSNVNIRNMLCYYQYEGGHASLKQPDDSKALHKTIIFNNTNQREMPYGRRVQLLYWNGENYVKVFPKGTHIGWALIQEGYNQKKYDDNSIKDVNKYRFSTLELSTVGSPKTTQGIARWSDEFGCNIVGMENREIGHNSYDGDYNDILFSVTATPVIKPDVEIPVEGDENPSAGIIKSEVFGTLAFEDMYPYKGDWDHNDFVTDYVYTKEQDASTGEITAIVLEFKVRALGGLRESGFGIELPVKLSNIARVIGAGLETTNDAGRTVIRIKDNVREFFNNMEGLVNTYPNIDHVESSADVNMRIELKKAVADSEVSFSKFNPFIFVNGREREIHLPDYQPTIFGKVSFGVADDATNGENSFYKTNEGHAWGLDIPRMSADAEGWIYPLESVSINDAYPQYQVWVSSNGNESKTWYAHPNKEKVYAK